ncbi:MAG: regulator [Magnetococcales bacterium]|nr:regulator [Magnetococcales bacterium]
MLLKYLISLAILAGAGILEAGDDRPALPPPNAQSVVAPLPKAAPPPILSLPLYQVLDRFEVGAQVYVRSLLVEEDRQALWVGTSVGVHEIDLGSKTIRQTFTREQGLANEYIFAIGRDSEGGKWFGTNAGGASRYHEGRWKTYFPMHGLADYWVYSFASHPDGTLWIGTWAGVNRLNLKTGALELFLKELVNEWVYAIQVDDQGRTWFGTEGGISRFDGQTWHSWTHADGLGAPNAEKLPVSHNTGLGTRNRHDLGVMNGGETTYNPGYVFALQVEKDGTVWAGTWGGGVSRFDGKQWRNYSVTEGLPGTVVYSLARDGQGTLWAGTDRGVAWFDGNRWHPLMDGHLQQSHVYTLATAPGGDLWAGSRGNVFRIGLLTNQPK